MAEAVDADKAFFSTCGSSLSVKASILAVTRGSGDLLIGSDAHKSVVAGLILSGLQPRWITPRWDQNLHIAHPPSPEDVQKMWERYPMRLLPDHQPHPLRHLRRYRGDPQYLP
jgi:arginine decarboxylase